MISGSKRRFEEVSNVGQCQATNFVECVASHLDKDSIEDVHLATTLAEFKSRVQTIWKQSSCLIHQQDAQDTETLNVSDLIKAMKTPCSLVQIPGSISVVVGVGFNKPLVSKLQKVKECLECTVCLDVTEKMCQCTHGHLLCELCRTEGSIDKCVICGSQVSLGATSLFHQLYSVFSPSIDMEDESKPKVKTRKIEQETKKNKLTLFERMMNTIFG